MSFLKESGIRFVEGMINEDLIFGLETFRMADRICFFNDWVCYRLREGSISCAKTFSKHSNRVLFRSYMINCNYLLSLLQKKELSAIYPLIRRCLRSCASMPFLCWIKDSSLCHKQDLKKLIPYVNYKVRAAFYIPYLARAWIRITKGGDKA